VHCRGTGGPRRRGAGGRPSRRARRRHRPRLGRDRAGNRRGRRSRWRWRDRGRWSGRRRTDSGLQPGRGARARRWCEAPGCRRAGRRSSGSLGAGSLLFGSYGRLVLIVPRAVRRLGDGDFDFRVGRLCVVGRGRSLGFSTHKLANSVLGGRGVPREISPLADASGVRGVTPANVIGNDCRAANDSLVPQRTESVSGQGDNDLSGKKAHEISSRFSGRPSDTGRLRDARPSALPQPLTRVTAHRPRDRRR